MGINSNQIEGVVLAEDDFGFELRVGKALRSVKYPTINLSGARVLTPVHGGTYRDPITQKPREFDYRCEIVSGDNHIILAVECKNVNPDFPVVVCGRPRSGDENYHEFFEVDSKRKYAVKTVPGISSYYRSLGFVGKRIIRVVEKQGRLVASKEGESEIYDRWSQALASTHDIAFGAVHGDVYSRLPANSRAFIIPMVVVPDSSLWRVYYNEDGVLDEKPTQIERCEYYVDYKLGVPPMCLTHIHFATVSGLLEMLQEFVSGRGREWDFAFSKDAYEK